MRPLKNTHRNVNRFNNYLFEKNSSKKIVCNQTLYYQGHFFFFLQNIKDNKFKVDRQETANELQKWA